MNQFARLGKPATLAAAVLAASLGLVSSADPGQATVAAARPAAGIISTVAGGIGGPGPGTNVAVQPCGIKFADGALYIGADLVRQVDPRTGRLTTPIADVHNACAVTVDSAGNVLTAGPFGVRVVANRSARFYGRKMIAGRVYVLIGSDAEDIELDHAGNLIFAVAGNPAFRGGTASGARVRVLAERTARFYGRKMTAGQIYTVAGSTLQLTRPGSLATRAWLGLTIGAARTDRFGDLVIADGSPVSGQPLTTPSVQVVAERTGRLYGRDMTSGHIYRIAGNGHFGTSGDGGPAAKAGLSCANGLAIDHAGNVVVADCGRVRLVAERTGRFYGRYVTAGHIYSIAGSGSPGRSNPPGYSGDGGPASRARLYAAALTVDSSGNVLLASPFRVRAVAASTGHFYGRNMRAGDIYTVVGTGTASSGNGGPARRAEFAAGNIAEGRSGNLMIADNEAEVRLVAAASGRVFGQKVTTGDIYTIAGDGRFGSTGDRGPATKASIDVSAMATDSTGNVLIAGFSHRRVRVVASRSEVLYGKHLIAGHIYTMAGSGGTGVSGNGRPAVTSPVDGLLAVATDHAGNVLVADIRNPADQFTDQVQVVAAKSGTFYGRQMTAGDIYTIAGNGQTAFSGDGGPATAAGMSPSSLAVDNAGDVLIGDASNGRVRVIAAKSGTFYGQQMTASDIYTIALGNPASMVVDKAGNVLIADRYGTQVHALAVVSGTFYGVSMRAGHIYTIAGTGKAGFTGDGGPAISAELSDLSGLALGPKGNLLIAGGSHVRSVTP
ncbi:MAG: hypothetical protein ACLQFR_31090 [Streptosporangiaceae bacterium]